MDARPPANEKQPRPLSLDLALCGLCRLVELHLDSLSKARPFSTLTHLAPADPLSHTELAQQVRVRQSELQALVNKINELEREAEEHSLVLDTLQKAHKTAPERKCFRLVGGVLVERTVQDVLPQLEGQFEQLKTVLETLTAQYKTKESAFGQFQRDNNIVIRQR
ncbi:hypothetical protein JCM8208_003374 [Rhodotorula glutinis]